MAPVLSKKQWALSHLFLTMLVILTLWSVLPLISQKTELIFLDIGQGDSILIRTPEHKNILIDAGLDTKVVEELGKALPFFEKEIDLFILTHPDRDHYVGVLEVLGKYKIKQVMLTGIANSDKFYLAFLDEIKRQNIPIVYPRHDEDLQIGKETYLDILYPYADVSLLGQDVKNKNDTSITLRLIHNGKAVAMLSGDAEADQERELVLSGQDLSANILKLGHHGSSSSTIDVFLKAVNPEVGVISAGHDNHFGHPHEEVMDKVSHLKTHSTSEEGAVLFKIF